MWTTSCKITCLFSCVLYTRDTYTSYRYYFTNWSNEAIESWENLMMDNANLGQPDIYWTRNVYKCGGIVEFFLNYT